MTDNDVPPVCLLDGDALASALILVVATAAHVGHAYPSGTALPYMKNVTSPEARFVRDVLTLSTKDLCDRWYGGEECAARLSTAVVADALCY